MGGDARPALPYATRAILDRWRKTMSPTRGGKLPGRKQHNSAGRFRFPLATKSLIALAKCSPLRGANTPPLNRFDFSKLEKVGHLWALRVGHLCSIFGPPKQIYDARCELFLIDSTRVTLRLLERLPTEPFHELVCARAGFGKSRSGSLAQTMC